MEDEKVKRETDPKLQLRGQLLLSGGLSIAGFAKKHGYKPKTVDRVIARYWNNEKNPRGQLSLEILERLKLELGSS